MPCVYLPGPAPAVTVANNIELTKNGNFHMFAANENGKLPFVFCKRKKDNGSLFRLVGKR